MTHNMLIKDVISQLSQKYYLTHSEVISEIENVFSRILSKWHQAEVIAFVDNYKLEAVSYHKINGVLSQQEIDITRMRGWSYLKQQLEISLVQYALMKQSREYKGYEHEIRKGEIVKIGEDHVFLVEIELVPGEVLVASCPYSLVGVHEREQLRIGTRKYFHIRRIDPVILGETPRLNVVVDRVSKNLVKRLLQKHIGGLSDKITVRCTKRFVGKKSFIEVSEKIPKTVILAMREELGEHLEVKVKVKNN